MSVVAAVALVVVAFVAMEGVSYLTHRLAMHGFGWGWHRSHHAPPAGTFERNDLFPVCFSALGFALFLVATIVPALAPLFWVGVGVTAYGACYLFVHEVYIHQRAAVRLPRARYLTWLRDSHRYHHRFGGEPYGMLLPFVSGSLRARPDAPVAQSLDRSGRAVAERACTRSTRVRL
jgi:beta-carotene 3-hydroxylase